MCIFMSLKLVADCLPVSAGIRRQLGEQQATSRYWRAEADYSSTARAPVAQPQHSEHTQGTLRCML